MKQRPYAVQHMTLNFNPLQPKQLQPKGDGIVLAVWAKFQ
jgi:hypothetical protein